MLFVITDILQLMTSKVLFLEYKKPCNITVSTATGFYQSQQPIVFWFRYLRISFRPIAVFQLSWVIVCVLAWMITSHLRALWCFSCTVFNGPKRKVMDNVSCTKRQRKVLMFGENIELLHWSAWRENVVSVRSTITGSMIVGRTFLIVLFFIRKPSFSFKPHYPSNQIPKHSFSNSEFEPPFSNTHSHV